MLETYIKVGHPPDFVMSRGKTEYFHSITVTIYHFSNFRTETLHFTNRSLERLWVEISSMIRSRFGNAKMQLNTNEEESGRIKIYGLEANLECQYKIESALKTKDLQMLMRHLIDKLNLFCDKN